MRHIGLSEIGAETLRRASAVHPIADLHRSNTRWISRGIEADILPTARKLGVGITASRRAPHAVSSYSGHWQKAPRAQRFPRP